MKSIKALLLWATIVSLSLCLFAGDMDKNLARGFDSIKPFDVYNLCRTLSSPQFAGRHTGHEGYTKAAQWAAAKFKQWGLKPLSKKQGYLQVSVMRNTS